MQFASLTNEDSTMILIGLYDIVYDFHQVLLRKLPPSLPTPDQTHPPTKKTKLPLIMLVTLMLLKFFVGHRSGKNTIGISNLITMGSQSVATELPELHE